MSNLILRTSISPYGDTTKGSVLTQAELDGNFIKLKGDVIYSAQSESGTVTLKKLNGNDISFGVGNEVNYWTGGTGAFSVKVINGSSIDATGDFSLAQGFNTLASGVYSHAEGRQTTASGAGSHAEGRQTTASGGASHAEGRQTTASGIDSHAGGFGSVASGLASFVHGSGSIASGTTSIVLGDGIVGGANKTVYVGDFVIKKASAVPVNSADSVGEDGSVTWDNTHFYWKANGQWLRVSGSTF